MSTELQQQESSVTDKVAAKMARQTMAIALAFGYEFKKTTAFDYQAAYELRVLLADWIEKHMTTGA